MKRITLLILLGLVASASADSSWRRGTVNPALFELLQTLPAQGTHLLSPSGQTLALISGNNGQLVEVGDPKKSRDLRGHNHAIHDSGWSRDGRVFATAGYEGKTRVWDGATGKVLAVLSGHSEYACSVALTADGKIAATGGNEDNWVKFFDTESGKEIRMTTTPGGATYAMAFSGDGTLLFTNHEDEMLRVIRVADGAELRKVAQGRKDSNDPKAPVGYASKYGFSSDGRLVAHPTLEGSVILRGIADWNETGLSKVPSWTVPRWSSIPMAAISRRVGKNGQILIWEVETGKLARSLKAGIGDDCRLAFRPDGQSMVVLGADDKIRIFGIRK